MGQKRRSSTTRQATSSNGSIPPPASVLLETVRSPITSELHTAPVDAGKFSNTEATIISNGEPVATAERPEIIKVSDACPEDPLNVKSDCEKALVALRRGNSNKALRLIRDACNRYEGSALVQRIRGHICMRLASLIEDQTTKQRHLKEAIDAAQKSVQLSPRSVEFAQFHAQLLFEAASDSKGYDEVVQECQRALEIQDPIDPAKESVHDESQQKFPTAEARISQVQQELRNLVQKANIASISNWMKTLGNGGNEEKLRFIHMRKPVDDPLEQRVSQPKRPHEVKKSVKTAEERRKDIEVRVAAARLLQQRRDCSPPASDDGSAKPAKGSGRTERRRSGGVYSRKSGQIHSIEEKIERIRPFWSSLSPKEREKLLEIPLDALKQQFTTLKPNSTSELLTEALEFALEMKTWRFWICCSCGERFTECQDHAEHMTGKHVGNIPLKLRNFFPNEVTQDIVDQIMVEDFRPLDGPKAFKLLIDLYQADMDLENPKSQLDSVVGESLNDEVSKSVGNSSKSFCESEDLDMSVNDRNPTASLHALISGDSDSNGDEQLVSNMAKQFTCDRNTGVQKTIVHVGIDLKGCEFPCSDDEERAKLLQKIFNLLRILIRNKCLASDHMEKIMHYALGELQSYIPASSTHYEFSHSPIYIRLLPASQLRHVFGYLRELANACGLDQLMETGLAGAAQNEEEDVILDRLILNENSTMLTLDERLIKEVPDKRIIILTGDNESMAEQTVNSKMEPQISPMPMKDGGIVDMQLSWIYQTADYEHQPAGWKQFREARAHQCRDILRIMEKEFQLLKSLCENKQEQLQLEEATNMAETLCVEELKKRESNGEGNFSAHETVLRKRKEELLDCKPAGLSLQQNSELDVITSILRDAQSIILHRFPYDGTTMAMSPVRLSDSDEENASRDPDVVLHDACIHDALQRKKEQCTSEINKLDARILRSIYTIQKLEQKLGSTSILDYRSVILPFVKSFLKVQIEEAAEKDAMEKSDAAQEAFLAELLQDGKATTEKQPNLTRSLKEKPKEKKKNKEQRRSKDVKRGTAAIVDTQQSARSVVDNGNVEEDGLNWELDDSQVMDMELKKMEAEQKWQAEVEDEERKLAEVLELQRRMEEEAKVKHLAELGKKNTEISRNIENVENDIAYCTNLSCTRTASNKANEITPSFSVQKIVNIIEEISSSADANGYHNYEGNMAEIPDEPVSLLYSENQESGLVRTKKSGKSRRKKFVQTTHDESNPKNSDEKSENASLYIEQTRSLVDNEMRAFEIADVRKKPSYKGHSNAMKMSEAGNDGEKSENLGHDSNQTFDKQLKADKDAEQRFQEELKQAMQESLVNVAEYPEMEILQNNNAVIDQSRSNNSEVGKGLQNEIGQYNCFLNVVIQSLWHLRRFREELLDDSSSQHVHMGDPCVVCALREIFVGLNSPSSDSTKEVVAPTALRIALSNLFSQKDFFQEAQMNDASEVLAVVFECLHKAFANNWASSDGDSDTGSGVGSWECQDTAPCIAHSIFALDISMQMHCTKCGLESRHLKYSTFFHNINANSLRTAKILYQESSLDELLRLVEMNEFLACDIELGGCGQQNYIHYLLRAAPHVFITVLGWQNDRESFENISATMDAIAVDMDVGIVYHGLDRGFRHRLVSVICYYGQHYHCFALNQEIEKWVMFDDTNVKVIGTYQNVMDTCRRGHLQPQVLFYEASSR